MSSHDPSQEVSYDRIQLKLATADDEQFVNDLTRATMRPYSGKTVSFLEKQRESGASIRPLQSERSSKKKTYRLNKIGGGLHYEKNSSSCRRIRR